jgi:Uri superfamily endonuclease
MQPMGDEPGIYTLIIFLPKAAQIRIGSLGQIDFDRGYYSYTGSARGPGGLRRVNRHIRVLEGSKKTRRWHIDYLLPHCKFQEAFITRTMRDLECKIARAIGEKLMPVPRFGCSDCRCISHLHHSEYAEEMRETVAQAHARAGLSLID